MVEYKLNDYHRARHAELIDSSELRIGRDTAASAGVVTTLEKVDGVRGVGR
jgi:hypothetical protein